MVVPVNATKAYVEPEAQYAIWRARRTHRSRLPRRAKCAPSVKTVYWVICPSEHSGDLETIYYGLATIQVEEGQPIRRQDTLGTLGEDGTLRLSVLFGGRTSVPGHLLGSGARGMKLFQIGHTQIRVHPGYLLCCLPQIVLGMLGRLLQAMLALTLHETFHAIVARSMGYRVDAVEFLPFGGVARLNGRRFPLMRSSGLPRRGRCAALS
jgi:hypothetical protein